MEDSGESIMSNINTVNIKGKKLLVLGGGGAAYNIVDIANKAGVYTIVADYYETGKAKQIASETVLVSTNDYDALLKLIKEKEIDGVFCGPSEFNILNVIRVCKMAGLQCYATEEQWHKCNNKATFKEMCRKYEVPCIPEYHLTEEFLEEDLKKIKYPVMVKPVDSYSSRGITVCANENELRKAYDYALSFSNAKQVIVEKFINFTSAFAARYLANNGEIKLELVNDQFTVGVGQNESLISAVSLYPSVRAEEYIENIDANVKKMFYDLGIKNGAFFMQALVDPDDGNIYFHEMGLRLSGGLIYKIVEPATGINDVLMMIRYALGESFATEEEFKSVDPMLNGKYAIAFNIPLKVGKIGKISGIESAMETIELLDYFQYYNVGDEVTEDKIGTLDQHFCRIKFFVDGREKVAEAINNIQEKIVIEDVNGDDMIYRYFDTERLNEM